MGDNNLHWLCDDVAADEKAFKFQGQKVLLTYAGHRPKQALYAFIEEAAGFAPKFIRAAHEHGTNDPRFPYLHTHLLVDFGKRFQCQSSRRFDIADPAVAENNPHPHWRPIKSIGHWRNCLNYIAKEDAENADLVTGAFVRRVWEAPTLGDALLANVCAPTDTPGIIALYNAKPRSRPEIEKPTHPWQEELIDYIDGPADHRTIHWVYDPVGNTGKSHLATYLLSVELAYVVDHVGESRDFATIVQTALDSGWNCGCMIFDLPRSHEAQDLYGSIERIKNQRVTSTKYKGGTFLLSKTPHVFVFANFLPDLSRCSPDRWRIHSITADFGLDAPLKLSAPLPYWRPDSDPLETLLDDLRPRDKTTVTSGFGTREADKSASLAPTSVTTSLAASGPQCGDLTLHRSTSSTSSPHTPIRSDNVADCDVNTFLDLF